MERTSEIVACGMRILMILSVMMGLGFGQPKVHDEQERVASSTLRRFHGELRLHYNNCNEQTHLRRARLATFGLHSRKFGSRCIQEKFQPAVLEGAIIGKLLSRHARPDDACLATIDESQRAGTPITRLSNCTYLCHFCNPGCGAENTG